MAQKNTKLPLVAFKKSSFIIAQGVILTKYYLFGIKCWTSIKTGPVVIPEPTGIYADELLQQIHSGKLSSFADESKTDLGKQNPNSFKTAEL